VAIRLTTTCSGTCCWGELERLEPGMVQVLRSASGRAGACAITGPRRRWKDCHGWPGTSIPAARMVEKNSGLPFLTGRPGSPPCSGGFRWLEEPGAGSRATRWHAAYASQLAGTIGAGPRAPSGGPNVLDRWHSPPARDAARRPFRPRQTGPL
jgi:hypothetical protein